MLTVSCGIGGFCSLLCVAVGFGYSRESGYSCLWIHMFINYLSEIFGKTTKRSNFSICGSD
jgi:hypothetical protein